MIRSFVMAGASAALLTLSATAFAQQNGTADEAKAMLAKTVAAIKADKAKTIELINRVKVGSLIAISIRFASISGTERSLRVAAPIQLQGRRLASTRGP
jgi:hypothetical protein